MTIDVEAPRVAGVGTGVVALAIAVVPAVWVGVFLILGGVAGTAALREAMLAAEPFAFPILGALAVLIGLAALWRDTKVGRILGVVAIALVVLQTAAVLALILL